MKSRKKYILFGLLILLAGGFYGLNADISVYSSVLPEVTLLPEPALFEIPETEQLSEAVQDTVKKDTVTPRYPVAKIVPEYKDLKKYYPIDLTTPETIKSEFQYNPLTNRYELRTKIGDSDITTPLSFTPEEYYNYSLRRSMDSYYKGKYAEGFETGEKDKKKDVLSLFDFNFDLGPADKIFGPGGVKLNANGKILTKIGITRTSTGNPTLTERQRNRTAFDFDSQIQANIDASVGDKLNYNMNYNTESTFDFDTKKINLAYKGKEDEILRVLEGGNVSMNTTNSLIRGQRQ
ncbi:hypothetical protein FACS189415_3770 [Bacteroidia bacterium]|nr:hypothetical protein FACS189415_3770 [Bacteroidia bacterium]